MIPRIHEEIHYFDSGLAVFKQDKKYGYLNDQGTVVIPPLYDEAYCFRSVGIARVNVGENFGYINRRGEEIWMQKESSLISTFEDWLDRPRY